MNSSNISYVKTPEELGHVARSRREKAGISLRSAVNGHAFGIRFLSEFERGKQTAELGKVMQALHAAGLELAVVSRPESERSSPDANMNHWSRHLNLEFPYDWSNPEMDESTLISLVLEKSRFNDILTVAHHFGIARIVEEAEKHSNSSKAELITKYLRRIKKGIALSRK
mgnify:CR=1 FL=1